MDLPVPPAFRLERETAPADWIVRRLQPWGEDRVRLWSVLPDAFEAYARVLHPAFRVSGNCGTVRWSELAAQNGVTLGPATGFREVSGIDPLDHHAWDDAAPNDGTIEREQVAAISELLIPFTRTPQRCWVAAWEGWGSWGPGSSATLTATNQPRRRLFRSRRRIARSTRRSLDRVVSEQKRRLADIPTVKTQARGYILFTARLADIASFEVGGWHQAPNIWWPDDRAWCVATEVDGYSTYVGGTTGCIQALLSSEVVEAIAVPPDVPIDPGLN